MRNVVSWSLLCVLVLLPSVLIAEEAQVAGQTGLALPGLSRDMFSGFGQGISLLDPQRLRISQSYGLTYSSRGKSADLVGLYQNCLSYRFSPRLNVKVHLGYLHQPIAVLSHSSSIRREALMTAFQLDFQPIDNFFIHFNFRSHPVIDYRDSLWRFRGDWGSMGD